MIRAHPRAPAWYSRISHTLRSITYKDVSVRSHYHPHFTPPRGRGAGAGIESYRRNISNKNKRNENNGNETKE